MHSVMRSFVDTAMEAYEFPWLIPTTGGSALIAGAENLLVTRDVKQLALNSELTAIGRLTAGSRRTWELARGLQPSKVKAYYKMSIR